MQFSNLTLTELFSILLNKALKKKSIKKVNFNTYIIFHSNISKEESEPANALIYRLAFPMM